MRAFLRLGISAYLLIFFLSCSNDGSGPGFIVSNPTQSGGGLPTQSGGSPATPSGVAPADPGSQVDDTSDDSGSGDTAPGGGEALPQASIPAPTLRRGLMVAYHQDNETTGSRPEESTVPVVGYAGAAGCPQGSQCVAAVSEQSLDQIQQQLIVLSSRPKSRDPSQKLLAGFPRPKMAPIAGAINGAPTSRMASVGARFIAPINQFIAPIIKPAHAQPAVGSAVLQLCDTLERVTCCPVQADGSFECLHQQSDQTLASVNVAVIAETANLAAPASGMVFAQTEPVQANAFYLRQAPRGLAANTTNQVFALSENGTGQEIQRSGTRYSVQGQAPANYQSFPALGAEQIATDSTNVALRTNSTDAAVNGIGLLPAPILRNAQGVLVVPNIGARQTVTVPEAERYEVLKRASDGQMWFGIRNLTNLSDEGFIFSTTNPTTNRIQFIARNDNLTHNRTLAFDVDNAGAGGVAVPCGLVLYEDSAQARHLRAICRLGNRTFSFGGTTPIQSVLQSHEFADLVIYQTSRTITPPNVDFSGRALLLDTANNRVWNTTYQITGDIRQPGTMTQMVTNQLDAMNGILVGNQPIALTLNGPRTRAYVLNAVDETISEIDLTGNGLPTVVRTIFIRNFLGQKTIALSLNGLTYQDGGNADTTDDDFLLMTSSSLRGGLVIPINRLGTATTEPPREPINPDVQLTAPLQ